MINQKLIETILQISKELVKEETINELNALGHSMGKIYDEATLAAEIAVKMALRIAGISMETRQISPVDVLVNQAIDIHADRYGKSHGI